MDRQYEIRSIRQRNAIRSEPAEGGLVGVSDVEEPIHVFALVVDFTHEGVALQDVPSIHEEVKRVTFWHLDALADDVAELVGRQVRWGQELAALVRGQLGGCCALADNRDLVWVLCADVG